MVNLPSLPDILKEWAEAAEKKQLKRRQFEIEKAINESRSRIVSITGIRRSGKSSLLMLIYKKLLSSEYKALYLDLEDDRLHVPHILDEILKYSHDKEWFLLDEITTVDDWDRWLHRINEMKTVNVIVSSSLNKLSKFPPKPLRGRISYFENFPLSFSEFLAFKDIGSTTQEIGKIEAALEEFLIYGGFPEVVLSEQKIKIIQEYLNSIVALDIANLSNVPFNTIYDFSLQLVSSTVFSASKFENLLKSIGHKIGKETILQLEHLFESAYLAFFIPVFSTKIKDEKLYPRKVYFGDTGFLYAIRGKKDFGRLYENVVYLHLRRGLGIMERVSYYKSGDGYEVDFVLRKGSQIKMLIQVTFEIEDEKTKNREVRALLKAAEDFNLNGVSDELIIITKNHEGEEIVEGKKIIYKKLWKWLLE